MNTYKEYAYISLRLCFPDKFFKWKIYKSHEKDFFLICLQKNRYQVFVNCSPILPIWWILFLFLFASFGIHKLFLFLFVQKLAPRIYSYSYSREKLLFADHCYSGERGTISYRAFFLHRIFQHVTWHIPLNSETLWIIDFWSKTVLVFREYLFSPQIGIEIDFLSQLLDK